MGNFCCKGVCQKTAKDIQARRAVSPQEIQEEDPSIESPIQAANESPKSLRRSSVTSQLDPMENDANELPAIPTIRISSSTSTISQQPAPTSARVVSISKAILARRGFKSQEI